MDHCTFSGCHEPVSKPGYTLCYTHWKASAPRTRAAAPAPATATPTRTDTFLSATILGDKLHLPNHKVNQILAELGWISREKKGWVVTDQGRMLGATQKEHHQTGVP